MATGTSLPVRACSQASTLGPSPPTGRPAPPLTPSSSLPALKNDSQTEHYTRTVGTLGPEESSGLYNDDDDDAAVAGTGDDDTGTYQSHVALPDAKV